MDNEEAKEIDTNSSSFIREVEKINAEQEARKTFRRQIEISVAAVSKEYPKRSNLRYNQAMKSRKLRAEAKEEDK